jgi:hypothetical protein
MPDLLTIELEQIHAIYMIVGTHVPNPLFQVASGNLM